MKTIANQKELSWQDLGALVEAVDQDEESTGATVQDLRERTEQVFGWTHNADAEYLMRTPHVLLGGESPWDVLYYSSGGANRLENVLDLVEQGILEALPVATYYDGLDRRMI